MIKFLARIYEHSTALHHVNRCRNRWKQLFIMGLCSSAGALDFSDTCVRSSWSTLLPTVVLGGIALIAIPLPRTGRVGAAVEGVKALFTPFLTTHEAELLGVLDSDQAGIQAQPPPPFLRTATLVFLGLVQSLAWLVFGSYLAILASSDLWSTIQPFLMAITWLYTVIRPIASPSSTPQYDVVTLYFLQIISAALSLGGVLYDHTISGAPFLSKLGMIALSLNLVISVFLMGLVLAMPLALPSNRVKREEIVSPQEDELRHTLELKISLIGPHCVARRLHDTFWVDYIQLGEWTSTERPKCHSTGKRCMELESFNAISHAIHQV